METHSDILAADAKDRERRQRAFFLERATNDHNTALARIKRLKAEIQAQESYVETANRLDDLCGELPKDVLVADGLVHLEIAFHVNVVRKSARMRIANAREEVERLNASARKFKKAIEEFQ